MFGSQVYSWGVGEHGKLGHGNTLSQRRPKQVMGLLYDKRIVHVSAGYHHSAAVTDTGLLYTWGEGDHGRLGHGDLKSRLTPNLVTELSDVGYVSCGESHTLVLSLDGYTVWSMGSGNGGKLGHDDTGKVMTPKIIEALRRYRVKKVCAGTSFSLALTWDGIVFWWGLGLRANSVSSLVPVLITDLSSHHVVDVSLGDSHVLALTQYNEVYAWGSNTMGQCGQDNFTNPVETPSKVVGLDDVCVRQICAGSLFSIAYTAPPSSNALSNVFSPFCVDVRPHTFTLLREFLETYSVCFTSGDFTPFTSQDTHAQFIALVLRLLSSHLYLALVGSQSNTPCVLGNETTSLRHVLFKLVDMDTTLEIEVLLTDCLAIGASLLLPPVMEQLQLIKSLLSQQVPLSNGQRMLLGVITSSLHKNQHLALLFRFDTLHTYPDRLSMLQDLVTLSCNKLHAYTLSHLKSNCYDVEFQETRVNQVVLLLQTSIIMQYVVKHCDVSGEVYRFYLKIVLPLAIDILERCIVWMKQMKDPELLNDILYNSLAGKVFFSIVHSLLINFDSSMYPTLEYFLRLLPLLDALNKLLRIKNAWLLELEESVALLIGKTLGTMLIGTPECSEEIKSKQWYKTSLFSAGMQGNTSLSDIETFTNDMKQALSILMCPHYEEDETKYIALLKYIPEQYKQLVYCNLSTELPEDIITAHMIEYNMMQEDPYIEPSKHDQCLCKLFLIVCIKLCQFPFEQTPLSSPEKATLEQMLSHVGKFRTELLSKPVLSEMTPAASSLERDKDAEEEDPIMKLVKGSSTHLVKQYLIRTPKSQKIVNLLSFLEGKRSLIFVKTYREASRILSAVQDCNMLSIPMSNPASWEHVDCVELLNLFNMGRSPLVIMTLSDFIGNDFSNVEQVIIYNLPLSINHYVFQIAGHKEAIAFYDPVSDLGLASSLVKLLEFSNNHVPVWLLEEQKLIASTSTTPTSSVAKQVTYMDTSNHADVRTTAFLNIMYLLCHINAPVTSQHEKLLDEILRFVLNDNEDCEWRTLIPEMHKGLQMQLERATSRCKALKQMHDLLPGELKHVNTGTGDNEACELDEPRPLLNWAYEQLLLGFFPLSPHESTQTPAKHYLSDIPCVSASEKDQVRTLVHQIYSKLIALIKHFDFENKDLQTLCMFCMSVPMVATDLSLVITENILHTLQQMIYYPGRKDPGCVTELAFNLIKILTCSCAIYIDELSSTVESQLVSALHEYVFNADRLEFRTDIGERNLGDELFFIYSLASVSTVRPLLATKPWISTLLNLLSVTKSGTCKLNLLRPRLISLNLLGAILPHAQQGESSIINELLTQLSAHMWRVPQRLAHHNALKKEEELDKQIEHLYCPVSAAGAWGEGYEDISDVSFDKEKCVCCTVEYGSSLIHGPGTRGYGVANIGITHGCYQWKFLIVNEHKGNEGELHWVSYYLFCFI